MASSQQTETLYNEVFISYSRKNVEFAQKLVKGIYDSGRENIWVDWEDIEYAEDWWAKIRAGIDSSNNFIFILTPDSVRSEICHQEIEYAVESGKRIIPIVHIPISEKSDFEKMHPTISSHNWLPFQEGDDFAASMNMLIKTIETDIGHSRFHTRLQTRAREWEQFERNHAYLLSQGELIEAQSWLARTHLEGKTPSPTNLQIAYIDASEAAEAARQAEAERVARRVQNFQRVTVVMVAVAVILIAVIVFAVFQVGKAQQDLTDAQAGLDEVIEDVDRQRQVANSLVQISRAQQIYNNGNSIQGLSTALEANDMEDPPLLSQWMLSELAYQPGARFVLDHGADVLSIAATSDGQIAISAGTDRRMIVWNLATGEMLSAFGNDLLEGQVNKIIILGDNAQAVSASDDGRFVLWDINTESLIKEYRIENSALNDIAVALLNNRALLGYADGKVILWDIDTWEALIEFDDIPLNCGQDVALSADGSVGVLGCRDGNIILLDTVEGSYQFLDSQHTGEITDVAVSTNGQMMLSSAQDNTIYLWEWDANEKTFIAKRVFEEDTPWPNSLAFSRNGDLFLSASTRGSIVVRSTDTGHVIHRFDGHTSRTINHAIFSADQRYVFSAAQDLSSIVWDLQFGAIAREIARRNDVVRTVSFSPNADFALSASNDNLLIQWDTKTGNVLQTFEGHQYWVNDIAISPDGEWAISASNDNTLILWDITSGNIVKTFEGHEQWVTSVDISPDGQYAISGGRDNVVVLWNIETGESRSFAQHSHWVWDVAFSPDGKQFASASADGSIILWDVESGEIVRQFRGHDNWVLSLAFAPDGKTLVSGSADEKVILWDIETGSILNEFAEHIDWVWDVAFASNGTLFASASADGSIILWDVASGEIMRRFTGHSAAVMDIDFSADELNLISASVDGTILMWRVDTLSELIAWTLENRATNTN